MSEEEIIKTIGEKASLWLEIHEFVGKNFDFSPELVFFTKNTVGQFVTEEVGKR